MPQSLIKVPIHLIFSTKNRVRHITEDVRPSLHGYIATVINDCGGCCDLINSVEDHVHVLFDLARTITIAEAVGKIKQASSKWIKTEGKGSRTFSWQSGYGAFAVSASNLDTVREYIKGQQAHHRHKSFKEEFRAFLHRHGVDYDERFIWD